MIVAMVDKTACTIEPLKRFEIGRLSAVNSSNHFYGFGGNGF